MSGWFHLSFSCLVYCSILSAWMGEVWSLSMCLCVTLCGVLEMDIVHLDRSQHIYSYLSSYVYSGMTHG